MCDVARWLCGIAQSPRLLTHSIRPAALASSFPRSSHDQHPHLRDLGPRLRLGDANPRRPPRRPDGGLSTPTSRGDEGAIRRRSLVRAGLALYLTTVCSSRSDPARGRLVASHRRRGARLRAVSPRTPVRGQSRRSTIGRSRLRKTPHVSAPTPLRCSTAMNALDERPAERGKATRVIPSDYARDYSPLSVGRFALSQPRIPADMTCTLL